MPAIALLVKVCLSWLIKVVTTPRNRGRQSARARERMRASSSLFPQAVQDFCKILLTKISSHRDVMSHVTVHSDFFIRTLVRSHL